jgi:hypothetical protein
MRTIVDIFMVLWLLLYATGGVIIGLKYWSVI